MGYKPHCLYADSEQKALIRILLPNTFSEAFQKSHLKWHRTYTGTNTTPGCLTKLICTAI